MFENYEKALDVTLNAEGGYVNNPNDPGGSTYKGVTQATYNLYRQARGENMSFVSGMSDAECEDIYRTMYWAAVSGDVLPSGVDLVVFDASVNVGPREAAMFLQRALNAHGADLAVDGRIGKLTLGAAKAADPASVIETFTEERLEFYRRLTTYALFGTGWTNRTRQVAAAASELIVAPSAVAEGPPPGEESAKPA